MSSKYIYTQVNGRKLKISNLDKVLYPKIGVTKAEVIQYYINIAPKILSYIKNRPLTLIRFPDGIDKNQFYAKTMPEWTPDWIDNIDITHSKESITYIVAQGPASVAWLANLAALELHPMQMTKDALEFPDHYVFDLDPPEDGDFEVVKEIALKLKDHIESYNHVPFIKTSGSKGLHIYVPIEKTVSHEEMTDEVKRIAKKFVAKNPLISTLAMSKEKRKGRTLIDIFRNHKSHTTVAPYSLRGKGGAPISFPIPWSLVSELKSSKDINIRNYNDYLEQYDDPWSSFYKSAKPLHNHQSPKEVDPQIADKLESYMAKRNLETSPEPGIEPFPSSGNQFCIQLHDAQNLHYDLRLEKEGVLMSWAIPKGLPFQKGVKRLAIRTEDHPMKYLTFEGVIPKGAYGAGEMWVFTKGTVEWIEQKDSKYQFKLVSPHFTRSYKLFKTKNQQWLIELDENFDFEKIEMPISPMLAGVRKEVPIGNQYIYEIKWDGIRCIIHLQDEKVTIYSRSGRDISSQFPELLDHEIFEVESGIFDGEIVSLDEQGRPVFSQVISRMHTLGDKKIASLSQKYPVVSYLFDCIMLDGKYVNMEPLSRRQAWLKASLKNGKAYRMSEAITDGQGLFEATKGMDLEGIMAKDKNASYNIGERSEAWLKVKHRNIDLCFIAGYTVGQGDRSELFGALHLLKSQEDGSLVYMGKVGTGFDSNKMRSLLQLFKPYIVEHKAFPEATDDDRSSIWLQPVVRCEVQYASLASSGVYREPVFKKLIDNK